MYQGIISKHKLFALLIMSFAALMLFACGEGPEGPAGPQGTEGTDGTDGATGPAGPGVQAYVGSAACGDCHEAYYLSFINSGHNYKLTKIINGKEPHMPFSNITGGLEGISDDVDGTEATDNTLGKPATYDDVSYIIGGFGWKLRFIDKNGFIVTGDKVQYNLADGSYSGYNNGSVDKKYDCGSCHTTGWKHTSNDSLDDYRNRQTQDDLPGMAGTFALQGIQCESCHGAGGQHVALANDNADSSLIKAAITNTATPRTKADFDKSDMGYGKAVTCGECHTRDGEKEYPEYTSTYETASGMADAVGGRIMASGNTIQHHEQYDELLGVDPDSVTAGSTRSAAFQSAKFNCISCHNPHTTTVYQSVSGDAPGMKTECTSCHTDKTVTGGMAELECIDCHMPKAVKSAINTGYTFTGQASSKSIKLGDIKSHILKIDLTKTMFITTDGKYFYPWLTVDLACSRCHSAEGNAEGMSSLSSVPAGYLSGTSKIHD